MKKLSAILVLIIVTACCGGVVEQVKAEPWPPLACQTAADFEYRHWGWNTLCNYEIQMIEWDGEWWPDDEWTIATPPPQTDEPAPTAISNNNEVVVMNTTPATDTTEEIKYHLRT